MGYSNPRKREVLGDIESGCGFPGDINNNNHPITGNIQGERLFSRLTGGVLRYNVVPSGESINNLEAANLGKPSQVAQENVALLINKNPGRLNEERSEKEHAKEKLQFANVKRPSSKPPRPPKGPLLDASDVKLVREISELVMKKRARRERIKALKKARAAKLSSSPSSSNNSTIFGMAITVVFFLIIIFQGFSWKNSSSFSLEVSPQPAATVTNSLISVEDFHNRLSSYGISPGSESPRCVFPKPCQASHMMTHLTEEEEEEETKLMQRAMTD
ncbi:hypothetical protein M9H77_05830 [Catharanthus roseus]|uniref:Uncharacterized protein n=1 Tax=Catharanthus roseus TaxID=4058 RepID=A0ACC0BQG9_CATRO|nr:hypothetical protein M9H77_05830 [Catharanthus roseus]